MHVHGVASSVAASLLLHSISSAAAAVAGTQPTLQQIQPLDTGATQCIADCATSNGAQDACQSLAAQTALDAAVSSCLQTRCHHTTDLDLSSYISQHCSTSTDTDTTADTNIDANADAHDLRRRAPAGNTVATATAKQKDIPTSIALATGVSQPPSQSQPESQSQSQSQHSQDESQQQQQNQDEAIIASELMQSTALPPQFLGGATASTSAAAASSTSSPSGGTHANPQQQQSGSVLDLSGNGMGTSAASTAGRSLSLVLGSSSVVVAGVLSLW